jgi:SAM-dependent methyltransferase
MREAFNVIAPRYDLVSSVMTLGMGDHWRRAAAEAADVSACSSVLDAFTGTGDLALMLADRVASDGEVIGVDYSPAMIDRARLKAAARGRRCRFEVADVLGLPFDDNRFDLEDMLVSPEHSRGYMWGLRKLQPINGWREYWDFTYEMGQYEGSKEMLNRVQFGYPVFYDSDYSHRGQNLGAGIGSGSNQWIFSLDRVKENKKLGFVFERIARNNDMLYARRVPWVGTWYGFDFTKKYVESSLGLNYSERRGPVLFWVKALLTQTYNWNYWYDPAGTSSTMRANGYNLKSLNVFTGATLLL